MLAAEAEAEGESMRAAAAADWKSLLVAEADGVSMLAARAAEEKRAAVAQAESEKLALAEAEEESEEESEEEAEWEARQAAQVKWERSACRFRECRCSWEFYSPTSRVAPGIDYFRTPDVAADHLPAWSLLVGVTDGASSLQVSRLRLARSGRILGRSDDVLEVFHSIVLDKPPGYCFGAGVAPLAAPDGRSICCIVRNGYRVQPQALQLTLQPQADTKELPLPEIEGPPPCHCIPISAHGQIWALSATLHANKLFSVVMRRLVSEPGGGRRWVLVDDPFISPLIHDRLPQWSGAFLQGYAVLPDTKLILVSFQQHGLFLTFALDSGCWTRVLTETAEERSQFYLPIFGRGIYVEQHKAVYMLRNNIIYAYKLTYQKDAQGKQQLKLELPVKIESVCPFIREEGYGFLTRLAGRRMCSVWISLAWHDSCPCDNLHAIVTTFDLNDPSQGGIKVLHSTYRRLDMKPNAHADQKFCFLQEYEDHDQGSLVLQQRGEQQDDLTSVQQVEEPYMVLSCCRNMLEMPYIPPSCTTIPPLGQSRSLPVDPASSQHQVCSSSPVVPVKPATTTIKKYLFIICQAGSRSVIYQTGAMGDDVKPLEPCYAADVGDHCWHFFQSGSKIHAVSPIRDGMLEFSLNKDRLSGKRDVRRPTVGPFVMVIRVGQEIIALTETLQVYRQTQFNYDGSTTWLRYTTDELDVVGRRVVISGYVAVNDDSFIVCDAATCSCLLFDMRAKQWRVVMPMAAFKENLPTTIHTNCLLSGRCVFVDGFIYTCTKGGLAAYELLGEDHSVYLSTPIYLPLSGHAHCVGEDMCLDYAGKDVDSGANLFYVVHGEYSPRKYGLWTNTFCITPVKVKIKRTAFNKMKPTGIDHMDSVRRFIRHTEAINMRCCFAVSYI